ncbi:MAG: Hsp20/alpha crystallin family protein [Kiritimatiellae bacterium]|nr:Hsp20/alpha crystallin family protein [Kiritimatiellia bacterium]
MSTEMMLGELTPWLDMRRLQRNMDRLLQSFSVPAAGYPPVNLWYDREGAMVQMEAPGMDPEKIKVSVEGQTLTVEGERALELHGEDLEYHRQERGSGAFARAVRLPFEAEAEGVKAEYRTGILTIRIPRKESTKPRAIPVAVG